MELTPGAWRVEELLAEVKTKLPYNLRYERATTGVVQTIGPAHTAPPASDKPLFTEEPADDDDP
ncbi:MAG: hypothetical protein ACRDQ4_16875 [Pseudonocardiaceae bacterium]